MWNLLCLISVMFVTCYIISSYKNLMYELPENGRDVPKHLGVLKVHALNVCVCDVCFELVL